MSAEEYRCGACGCFLCHVDTSTESGYDFELVCNNDNCPSKKNWRITNETTT